MNFFTANNNTTYPKLLNRSVSSSNNHDESLNICQC